jgi:cytoplasmic FMR1 interacting protein
MRPDSPRNDKKKGILKHAHITAFQAFLDGSRSWSLLVDALGVAREASNLPSLWFRERHLDLAWMIQFPVRSSLPFILTSLDHPELHDSKMFPFEISNDCAYAALNTFRSQYLYREIEAEVSLSIDMLAFTFSETISKYCHEAMELPIEATGSVAHRMVRQNKHQLLGSAIDFNLMTTTKLNQKLRKELESYIELLTDVRLLPYVGHLIRVSRTTHSLLVQTNLRMDEFDTIWERAVCSTKPLAVQSNLADAFLASCDFPRLVYNCDSLRFRASHFRKYPLKRSEIHWRGTRPRTCRAAIAG